MERYNFDTNQMLICGVASVPTDCGYHIEQKNFSPRVGLAYQLNSKTVIRAAYGIFYNSTFVQELQDLRKFWPYTPQELFTANTGTTPDLLITDAARTGISGSFRLGMRP